MSIELSDVTRFDKTEYQRGYNASEQGRKVRTKYRKGKGKHVTDAHYLGKKIVAIDGEGINVTKGVNKGAHLYVLLAVSGAPPLVRAEGLRSREIFEYLWKWLDVGNINVIYGGSYDFNLWIRDLLEDEVRALYRSSYTSSPVQFAGYGLRWIKGKSFEISLGEKTITINDVISFFQRSFVQACDEYLGSDWIGRDVIVKEKALRGNFKIEDILGITEYNNLELDRIVDLVSELRARLNKVGLRPRRWNSPGAIAGALFQREGVKQHRNENLPEAVQEAGRYAYAGGRFEMLKYGKVDQDVYEYDINSAYPAAMRELPSLIGGEWKHATKASGKEGKFTLYKVRFTGTNTSVPAPMFVRGKNGTICYPLQAENWIWSPEFEVLKEYCGKIKGSKYCVLEVWEYIPSTDYKPFHFIQPLYDMRKALKAAGDGAHVGIKLALNSLYGKLAQQVGWIAATRNYPVRVPTYHQLEWAGYITSWCRANVLRAALTDIDAVIAFETDAVFSTRPLKVQLGTGLGEWEETRFSSLTYVQSGHYYGTSKGKEIIKCRGIDKGFISRKNVEDLLGKVESERVLEASLTRFYGAGIALVRGLTEYWCKWLTEPKYMQLMPTGKRLHGDCHCNGGELELGIWHTTYCPIAGGKSSEYPVAWINPDRNMSELEEARNSENFFTD